MPKKDRKANKQTNQAADAFDIHGDFDDDQRQEVGLGTNSPANSTCCS